MTTKPFVLMFKASAPASEIDNYVAEVTKRGGTIRQRFNADFLRGFSAQIPSEYADSLYAAVKDGKHNNMYVPEALTKAK
ncbi:hypothetical protein MVES1_002752 [Malassezia vespertilionis]|uniref:uncharacterized protein n=1 Tax=Malassezia vespertilionis TaxID=2020962 RepID=UPI0024B1E01B|nr:uncharacterized protein MVES1_002752 [Malassezia vespertilionis]WFD07388.1 hypothetical protein MVES1_002752 [Malassezia vespertilionis]